MRAPFPVTDVNEPWSRRLFSEIVAKPEGSLDLGEAAFLIACEEYPDLDVPHYMARLDFMAASVRNRAPGDAAPTALLSELNRYLFEEQGFHGNAEDYYDPRNSFLNDVLDRRTGIPVTLSALYMEVGRRLGLGVRGVGLPGHFIVQVHLPSGVLLVDPFHGGSPLTWADCQKRLDRIYRGGLTLDQSMLEPMGTKEILARMLRNLKVIYSKSGNALRAVGVLSLLLRLDPGNLEDLRERGLLYAELECYALAAQDLELALVQGRAPEGARGLQAKIADLRMKAARLN
jgi:regulator of sirC expression with transglutaminase-like and TPR domain